MSDCIVYGQNELEAAIKGGKKHITLCAGIFNIPKSPDTVFDCIGPVKVKLDCGRAEADDAGMQFNGIYPEFKNDYAISKRALMNPIAVTFGGSGSSFGSGSYLMSSYSSGSRTQGNGSLWVRPAEDKPIYVFGYGIDLI